MKEQLENCTELRIPTEHLIALVTYRARLKICIVVSALLWFDRPLLDTSLKGGLLSYVSHVRLYAPVKFFWTQFPLDTSLLRQSEENREHVMASVMYGHLVASVLAGGEPP